MVASSRRLLTRLAIVAGLTAAALIGGTGPSSIAIETSDSIEEARLSAAGIRRLSSEHLELFTDLAVRPEIDSLPALFDAAVPLWAAYFRIGPAKVRDWRVRAFLIGDREKFAALGLMPSDRELVHGYADAYQIWVLDQTTDYYRRHLVLHEGTHAFMAKFLGGCGPGWYSEGMAELLGTHRVEVAGGRGQEAGSERSEKLQLNIMPRDRREVPMLGRIKLVRDAVAAGDAPSVEAIMAIDGLRQQEPQAYAWCWALTKFLDSHPRYGERFRKLPKYVTDPNFNQRVRRVFARDWPELAAEWQAYVTTLDHGYDFGRMAIAFERGTPLSGKRTVEIRSDRGWQPSGVRLEAGKTYRVSAHGRYQIAEEDGAAWHSEPGGVTIEYVDGHPLGMLLGAVVAEDGAAQPAETGLGGPLAIGLGAEIAPASSGTLYLRVNDSAANLGDNRGALTIEVEGR